MVTVRRANFLAATSQDGLTRQKSESWRATWAWGTRGHFILDDDIDLAFSARFLSYRSDRDQRLTAMAREPSDRCSAVGSLHLGQQTNRLRPIPSEERDRRQGRRLEVLGPCQVHPLVHDTAKRSIEMREARDLVDPGSTHSEGVSQSD
jgi:hypothetical protein